MGKDIQTRVFKGSGNDSGRQVRQYIQITLGAFLMAVAVVCYFDRFHVVTGGVTGIAVILKGLFDIPMWIVNASVNLPLFVLAYRRLNRRSFVKTLYATVMLTVALGIVPVFDILTGEMLVDMISGAVFMGTGLGLIISANASSGGSDLAATLLNKRFSYLSIPKIMAIIDAIVILAGMSAFGAGRAIYSIIAIYVITKISDYIMEGPNRAKLIYIISECYDDIARYITCDLERGASYINLEGVYTKQNHNMIMCVVSAREMVKIKEKTYKIDENAICFVGDIREAFGEGFTKFIG